MTLTERWGFFVLSKSDSPESLVGFCLEKCMTLILCYGNPDKNA
jgi:hypothetical protein